MLRNITRETTIVVGIGALTVALSVLRNAWFMGFLPGIEAGRPDDIEAYLSGLLETFSVVLVVLVLRPSVPRGVAIAFLYLVVVKGLSIFINLYVAGRHGLFL
jgi:hypothetical protein